MRKTINYTPVGDALLDKSILLAIRIVFLNKHLTSEKKEYVLSKQILRSGTSPGAMIREAKNAETGKDFIHKLSIGQKEIAETLYWLDLLFHTEYLSKKEYESLRKDTIELQKIVRSAILTRKKNLGFKFLLFTAIALTTIYTML